MPIAASYRCEGTNTTFGSGTQFRETADRHMHVKMVKNLCDCERCETGARRRMCEFAHSSTPREGARKLRKSLAASELQRNRHLESEARKPTSMPAGRERRPLISTTLTFSAVLSPFGEQIEDGAANSEQRECADENEEDHARCAHGTLLTSSLAVAFEEFPELRWVVDCVASPTMHARSGHSPTVLPRPRSQRDK